MLVEAIAEKLGIGENNREERLKDKWAKLREKGIPEEELKALLKLADISEKGIVDSKYGVYWDMDIGSIIDAEIKRRDKLQTDLIWLNGDEVLKFKRLATIQAEKIDEEIRDREEREDLFRGSFIDY